MAKPEIVSLAEWEAARAELLTLEKAQTRALDALAAKRRRLPMVEFPHEKYTFTGSATTTFPSNNVNTNSNDNNKNNNIINNEAISKAATATTTLTLLDLFGPTSDLLVVYTFMDIGPSTTTLCPGCSYFTCNVSPHSIRLLSNRGISYVTVSDMPLSQIETIKRSKNWGYMPFVSSKDTTFKDDHGGGISVFWKVVEGEEGKTKVYRTYSTTYRGTDRINFVTNVQDLTVWGRKQEWEDSPEGWPQFSTYGEEAGMSG